MAKACLAPGSKKPSLSPPPAPDDRQGGAAGRAGGHDRCRGLDGRRRANAGGARQDALSQGGSRDGPAGGHKAAVSDLHEALRPDMLEEAPAKLDGVEVGGAWP